MFWNNVEQLKINELVEYKGYVSRTEYLNYLINAEILCMTRNKSEYAKAGFPFKLGEMLASGRPVIASRLPGIEEYLNDTQVIFFEPEDPSSLANKINFILNNQKIANEIGLEGQKRCKEIFSTEKINFKNVINYINYN